MVQAHGGTDAANASTADSAENWLDNRLRRQRAVREVAFSLTTQVVLKANPKYWGPKPAYSTIVLRNTPASVQRLDVLRGGPQIAPTCPQPGLRDLGRPGPAHRIGQRLFLFTNESPAVSKVAANKDFQQAVRYGIDYGGLVSLAGAGGDPDPGIIPSMFLGSLPAASEVQYDLAKAKAALKASGIANPSVSLAYPSDIQVNGLSFGDLASRLQLDLGRVGIKVKPWRPRRSRWRSGPTGPVRSRWACGTGARTSPIRATISTSCPGPSGRPARQLEACR